MQPDGNLDLKIGEENVAKLDPMIELVRIQSDRSVYRLIFHSCKVMVYVRMCAKLT